MDLESLIKSELKYFESAEQRAAFDAARVGPSLCTEAWQYGPEKHTCTLVARDDKEQIVYCSTGFGPEFPWSVQFIGETDLGNDGEWYAYLYEAFVSSTMWPAGAPEGFMHMGRGERAPN
jgi:hypothetical protein